MSLQKKFEEFNQNIKISWQDPKMKNIRDKNESIEKDIRTKFNEEGYGIQEVFNQGSYANNTTIIPIEGEDYDIDRGIVIKAEEAPEDPREPKKKLKEVLESRNLKDPKIKVPCVTAQYYKEGEKNFHIDYPIYKKDSFGRYYLARGKETSNEDNREWQEVEIKELLEWLNASEKKEEERKQYKRLVMYMKKWRNHNFSDENRKKIYSVGLAVMLKEQFESSISYDGEINDLQSLYNTVCRILSFSYFTLVEYDSNFKPKYNINVPLPKKPFEDIFRKHGITIGTILKKELDKLKQNLEEVLKEDKLKKQCEKLKKIFGDEFPESKDEKEDATKSFNEFGYVSSPQGA